MLEDTARYDAFWAGFFGVDIERVLEAGISIVPHAGLGAYSGVWFFTRGASTIISAPSVWLERLRVRTDDIEAERVPSAALLRELFGSELERVIGPAYQGALSPRAFRAVRSANARDLSDADDSSVQGLRAACGPEQWEHSGLSNATERMGYFRDGHLVAMAGLDRWSADAAGPGVLSHPDHRGRGYGTALVSAVVDRAIASGRLVLYQTLEANRPSVAIAQRLGFSQYARHLAVRLRREP